MQLAFLLSIVGLLIFDTMAMGYLKQFTVNNQYGLLALAFGLEAVAWFFLIWGIRARGMVVTNSVWDVTSFVAIALVGVLIFKERLDTHHWLGLIAGLVAIALLTIE